MNILVLCMLLVLAVLIGMLVLVWHAVEAEGKLSDQIFAERMKRLGLNNE